MGFIKQIGLEMRNILRSRFLLVITIIVVAAGLLAPIAALLLGKINFLHGGMGPVFGGGVMYKDYAVAMPVDDSGQPPIEIEGTTLTGNNQFYWQVQNLQQMRQQNETNKANFTSPQALDLAQALIDEQLHYYAQIVRYVPGIPSKSGQMDYRYDLSWMGQEFLFDKFIMEHIGSGTTEADMKEALNNAGRGYDDAMFKKKYVDIDATARQKAIDTADQGIAKIMAVVENNDFPKYIDLRIEQSNQQIADMQASIELMQKQILENPSLEESLGQSIEQQKKSIQVIQETSIPMLQYRLQKNFIPGQDIWQNNALQDVESGKSQLSWMGEVLSEEKFNKRPELIQQYGNYKKYVDETKRQIVKMNNQIMVAQKSLDAEKPDMKYVPDGARNKTTAFLSYSVFVALFGVLLGGWMIASEFQQGTVRLLMIRPKTRVKILLSKYSAALALSLIVYLLGSILNLLTNGVTSGFGDFANPNFSINGSQSFLAFFLPKLLACMLPIVFGLSVAFLLGVLLRNSAVAIVIPVVAFIGCTVAMGFVGTYPDALGSWLAYTPVPYLQLADFFLPNSSVQSMIERGLAFSLPMGLAWLSVLSVLCTGLSVYIFRKRDITN